MSSCPFPPGASVAAYFRDSGGVGQDLSIRQQEHEVRSWCSANELRLTIIFQDEAQSASSTTGRADFIRMIEYFGQRSRPELGVVIWKLSRFAREIDDAQYFKASLRRNGYIVHSLQDNIPTGPEGRVFETMVDWMNARYLKDLSEDVKRGQRHNLNAFGGFWGTPPRGFMFGDPVQVGLKRNAQPRIIRRWVPDPDMVPLVRKAFHMRAQGASLGQILKETELFSSTGSMTYFFKNEIYIGRFYFGGELIENFCEPIIDMDTWELVQNSYHQKEKKMDRIENMKHHPRTKTSDYLLTGLLQCRECGAPMTGHSSTNKAKQITNRYYSCTNRKKTYGDRCNSLSVPKDQLELFIVNELTEHILDADNLLHVKRDIESRVENDITEKQSLLKQLQNEQKENNRALTNLLDSIERMGYIDVVEERIREKRSIASDLDFRIQKMKEEIERLTNLPSDEEIQELGSKLRPFLNSVDNEQLRIWMRSLIEHIEVTRKDENLQIAIFYYFPDEVVPTERSHRSGYVYRHDLVIQPGWVDCEVINEQK
jgi:DNA invertase Pin-like site-specific DNA recombinase